MKYVKMLFMISFAFAVFISVSMTNVYAEEMKFRDVEIYLDRWMEEQVEKHHIPNATIAVVQDGEVLLEKGYGFADLEQQLPVQADRTLFRIGSTSKLFTWTAIMQLVEAGKLDLDEDINKYIDFEIPAHLEGMVGDSAPQPITLTHLMTHTPGFEDYSNSIFRLSEEQMPALEQYVRQYLPKRVFPAGEVAAYSNYGTALAGYIVEQASGLAFEEYVQQNIYAPLGMEFSSFHQPLEDTLIAHMAKAYRYVDGEYREGSFEFVPGAAGGMSSTAADMAKFMLAYLQQGSNAYGKILEEETVQQMLSQQFTHHPSLSGMAHGFIEATFNEQRVLLHPGSTMLFDTGLYLLPEENVGIFISYSGANYLVHTEIFQQFMDHYYPTQQETNINPPAGSKERSSKYIGEYHQNRKSFTTDESFISLTMGMIDIDVDEEGYLLVSHVGETNRFVEVKPGEYLSLREGRTPDGFGDFRRIVFDTDPYGQVMLMTDGPMTYSQMPWYATSTFTFGMLINAILLIMGSILYWGLTSLIGKIRGRQRDWPKLLSITKWMIVTYGGLIVLFIVGVALTGQFDPVYQLPQVAFGVLPAWSPFIDLLPLVMALLGIAIIILTVLAWVKGYGRVWTRLHYTVITAMVLVILWILNYWNVLFVF